jgi:hypothetical protein
MDNNRDSAPNRPRRRGHALRWAAGVAAVAVLAGGGAALAAGTGSSRATTATDQAAALSTVLSSADAPTAADLAAAAPAASTTAPTGTSPAATSPAGTGPAHPCARAAAALRAAGHPRAARRAGPACRARLGRLRRLIRGEHGQVTFKAKDGTTKTLAFERGKITAVSGTAVAVTAADGTTSTWHLVSDSVVRQGGQHVSASALAAGQQVFAGGPVVSGADDARLIVIRPAAPAPSAPAAPSSSAAPSGS